ncbi:Murein DD-endopeptidase MepM and murein hydrolase activator NlpD, contain LysM domain [Agromyces sp. CF514]|uniref:M23 family metallopeptidase n=1 Tax=Agromyces sp. CF514 TaxID=1881031 RepID=UPI0008EF5B98|nr:M23 family metallopeptidase [Agromyces sp. CF514]SFR84283.1 Murein DD-endopeptidase MepM and murein hydrolase activator NlpD, contain LysM domain [Agromyces sp. CF514]
MKRTRSRTSTARTRRLVAGLAVIAAALVGAVQPVASPQVAFAADYPTWDELQEAKANTKAGAAAVVEITGLIAQLEDNVAATRAEAERRTDELIVAQQAYDDAVYRADQIQAQADAAAKQAAEAEANAGQVAAQLYRAGTGDVGVSLFLDAGDSVATETLLGKLGSMEKMVERTSAIYDGANEAANTATALAGQADVAQAEREKLRIAAEEALAAAQAAQAAAEAALAESEAKKVELEAQLKFLKDTEAKTSKAYEEGERIRKEEERKRREAEEKRRQEALANGSPGTVASSGWALPAWGSITGNYGPRSSICTSGGCSSSFHYAVDLGTGCGAPIYAANSGVVRYAGWSGTYGNYVQIDHGGGVWTGYAHIVEGGILVGYGQWVSAGQQIAWSGTTGASTGCHLHFEVYTDGYRIDPIPFMAARGVGLG